METKEIVCNGVRYPTIKEFSSAFSKSPSTVARRLRGGWSPEEAVGLRTRKRIGHGISVLVKGRKFRTIKDACTAYSVDPKTIRARISKGYSAEDAILGNLKQRGARPLKTCFEFNGKFYKSGKEVEAAFKIKWALVVRRMKVGWTKSQALGVSDAPPRFRNFEGHARSTNWKQVRVSVENDIEPTPDANGYKLYVIRNLKNNLEYIGITVQGLQMRFKQHIDAATNTNRRSRFVNAIRKYGKNNFSISLIRNDAKSFAELQNQEIEEIRARDTVRNGYNTAHGGSLGTAKSLIVNGKIFPSRAQAAEYHGIEIGVFNLRLNRLKWTPEEAAGLVDRQWSGKARVLIINRETFGSVRSAAAHFNKDVTQVYDRISKGWTPEQALELEPAPKTVKHRGVEVIFEGMKFQSLSQLANSKGVHPETIRRRLKKGIPLSIAIERALRRKRKKQD